MRARPSWLQIFLKWPLWQRVWFVAILGGFWLAQARFCYEIGDHTYFHTDETTEGMSVFAARHYLDHGFFEHYLLPTYPPFGHAPDGSVRHEPFVYNHYLAGADLMNAAVLKIFGREQLWVARLVPHTLTVLALAFLAFEFSMFLGSGLMGCFMLSMLMIPRAITAWSICLYGHSYAMVFYLCMVAGLLRLIHRPEKQFAWLLGIGVGLGQMFFDLDWVALTFLSAASIVCLMPRLAWEHGRRVLIGMVIGAVAALFYQVVISALNYGSMQWVVDNLWQWIRFRSGTDVVEGMTQGDLRIHKILHEYNRQAYGATGFTAFNLMGLSGAFLLLGFFSKALNARGLWRGVGSIALSYLAAAAWNIVMRQHSVAHVHFLPRHYIVVFMNFALIALAVSYELVVRARQTPRVQQGLSGLMVPMGETR